MSKKIIAIQRELNHAPPQATCDKCASFTDNFRGYQTLPNGLFALYQCGECGTSFTLEINKPTCDWCGRSEAHVSKYEADENGRYILICNECDVYTNGDLDK